MVAGRITTWLLLLPVLAGSGYVLGLAPYGLWPATVIAVAILYALLIRTPLQNRAFATGWLFGVGQFGVGASWVYVSINVYGQATPILAGTLTATFCAGLAVLSGLQISVFCRLRNDSWTDSVLLFPSIWVLSEWTRSWLLTGFPWLYAGYAGIDTPLQGWGPILGVYGLGFILVAAGSSLSHAILQGPGSLWRRSAPLATVCVMALLGYPLQNIAWTTPIGPPLSAAIYQPNIPLEEKWDRRYFREILERYAAVGNAGLREHDLVLLPESAVPAYRDAVSDYLNDFDALAASEEAALITGIPTRNDGGRYNSIIGLGTASGQHHKQKLVPFGEYVPLEGWLRGAIAFFDLPMSNFQPGPVQSPQLRLGAGTVATFICYEIVYPDFVSAGTRDAGFIITVSNDSWFGRSIGPLQHLEMARFRALATGRPLLRGTNNGVSAFVDHTGTIQTRGSQFTEEVIAGSIQPRTGETPVMRFGSAPTVTLGFLVTLGAILRRRRL